MDSWSHKYQKPGSAQKVFARFWTKVDGYLSGPDNCWIWQAGTDKNGYGMFQLPGGPVRAHRLAYEMFVGEIPEGLTLDHHCGVTRCVNPHHLEPVTGAENVRRSQQATRQRERTHCNYGHPFSGRNLIITNGKRRCRECANRRARESTARRRLSQCSVDGCERPLGACGLCSMHYWRKQHHGEVGDPEPIYPGNRARR
jgi:hypothetical protein